MAELVSRSRPPGRIRSTRQAAAIQDVLREADGFRTAQQLFDELRQRGDSVGLTTVYRNLNLLAESGMADVVHRADGESQFRLCGGRTETQIITTTSSAGYAVRSVEVAGPEVEKWAERVAAEAGYTQISHTVELFGLCPDHS